MKLSLKIAVIALIVFSVFIAQAITERTGLLSEGLLLGFIFLVFGAAILIALGRIAEYFEKEIIPKKNREI
jgi:hypothetical protein